ncbi:MAG: lecithin retinol acyltransferase family protein [Spirulinaceae cyanobacterium]
MDSVVIEPGDHLFYSCNPHYHHGIYCGDINYRNKYYRDVVVHLEGKHQSGTVKAVAFDEFALNRNVYVKRSSSFCFSAEIVVERAINKLGKSGYDLFFNNCEHFCNWCKSGKKKSSQINTLLFYPRVSSLFMKHSYAKVRGRKRYLNNSSNYAKHSQDTDFDSWIVKCSHCNRKNRVPKYYQGNPICGQCKSPLFS